MTESLNLIHSEIPTPIGVMLAATDLQNRLRVLDWKSHERRMHRLLDRIYGPGNVHLVNGAATATVVAKLQAFFNGDIGAIADIPVETGGTAFQRAVWTALRHIPAGVTWSYSKLASHIGRPTAVRAVGAANGANPIGVVVPCHRVIGANGSLTGYGGGIERKQWLLNHERMALAA